MGCFDTIVGQCPVCKKGFDIQTKLSECLLRTLSIGDDFPFQGGRNCKIFLKYACPAGHAIMMVLEDGRIVGFEDPLDNFDFDYMEGHWGHYAKMRCETTHC